MDVKKVTAYQCPYCGYYALNKGYVEKHANTCCKNENVVMDCLHCSYLEKDFVNRILFPKPNSPYCCQKRDGGSCIYKNHTTYELFTYIDKKKKELEKYGIMEDKNGNLVWKTNTKGTS